jgi:hypothetical protein
METQSTKQGKVIGNVGILDLRAATEASIAQIQEIGNVGAIIHAPNQGHLVSQLNIGNLGAVLEVPDEISVKTGQEVLSRDSFKNQAEPLQLFISGQLIINPDVPEADVRQGLGSLNLIGQIFYPEHLAGALQSRLRHLSGQMLAYQHTNLVVGNLRLDQSQLQALDDNVELSVIGKLIMPQVLPDDLLAQKIGNVEVFKEVICREENAQTLLARLNNKSVAARITIIPAGFEWVTQPLDLDAAMLEVLPGQKLYCLDRLLIGDDVEAEALDGALDTLIIKDLLICPASLKRAMARKCNLLETKAIFYTGELWLVDGDLTLAAARFDFLADEATLVNFGDLTLAADVEPKTLADRLARVHNFGDIFGTAQQNAALQARLGINEGDLLESGAFGSEDSPNRIGNVGHLKL